MQKEIDLLINLLKDLTMEEIEGSQIFHGSISSKEVIVAKCGIGKVNSALNTFLLIRALHPDIVINSGVAGGAGVPVGTVLIPERVAYHDVWCGPGTSYGQADGMPLFFQPSQEIMDLLRDFPEDSAFITGLICSGDKFVSTPEEIRYIREKFPDVCAVDMESASIAQVCFMTNTPFAIIRIVSDTPGEGENISQYKEFWIKAPAKTFDAVKFFISALK